MENIRVPHFFEDDEIVFHLAAMSQCGQRGEGHLKDSAHADKEKFQLVRIRANVVLGVRYWLICWGGGRMSVATCQQAKVAKEVNHECLYL
jgi:hypothetical protein